MMAVYINYQIWLGYDGVWWYLFALLASDYILMLFVDYTFYSLVQESKRMCKMLKRDSKFEIEFYK